MDPRKAGETGSRESGEDPSTEGLYVVRDNNGNIEVGMWYAKTSSGQAAEWSREFRDLDRDAVVAWMQVPDETANQQLSARRSRPLERRVRRGGRRMSELTKGPWKAKRLATYQEPGWVVVWPDKGGTYMRRLDSNGNFTGPDAALIAAAPELLAAARKVDALSIQTDAHKELRAAVAKATEHDA